MKYKYLTYKYNKNTIAHEYHIDIDKPPYFIILRIIKNKIEFETRHDYGYKKFVFLNSKNKDLMEFSQKVLENFCGNIHYYFDKIIDNCPPVYGMCYKINIENLMSQIIDNIKACFIDNNTIIKTYQDKITVKNQKNNPKIYIDIIFDNKSVADKQLSKLTIIIKNRTRRFESTTYLKEFNNNVTCFIYEMIFYGVIFVAYHKKFPRSSSQYKIDESNFFFNIYKNYVFPDVNIDTHDVRRIPSSITNDDVCTIYIIKTTINNVEIQNHIKVINFDLQQRKENVFVLQYHDTKKSLDCSGKKMP